MSKVGEHITLDIIGTSKEYEPKFFEKLVFRKNENDFWIFFLKNPGRTTRARRGGRRG